MSRLDELIQELCLNGVEFITLNKICDFFIAAEGVY